MRQTCEECAYWRRESGGAKGSCTDPHVGHMGRTEAHWLACGHFEPALPAPRGEGGEEDAHTE